MKEMKIKTLAHETIETIYSLYVWMNDVVVETMVGVSMEP